MTYPTHTRTRHNTFTVATRMLMVLVTLTLLDTCSHCKRLGKINYACGDYKEIARASRRAPADLCHPKCWRWFVAHCLLFSHDYLKRGERLHTQVFDPNLCFHRLDYMWSFVWYSLVCRSHRLPPSLRIPSLILISRLCMLLLSSSAPLSTLDCASFFTNKIGTRKFSSENQMDCRWNGYIRITIESISLFAESSNEDVCKHVSIQRRYQAQLCPIL